jgi:hypothetical protein
MFAKIAKKIVAVTLCASMALSVGYVANSPSYTIAAAKKLSLAQGAHKKLTAGSETTWETSNKEVACPNINNGKKAKSVEIVGTGAGKATITNGEGQSWAVTVKKAKKGAVVYDMAKETDTKKVPPATIDYNTWKYDSFAIFLFSGTYYGYGAYAAPDYRGRKLSVNMKIKNDGERNIPELGVCFNYTTPVSYPFAYHLSEKPLDDKIKTDKGHSQCTFKVAAVKPGKSINIKFNFTIPKDAQNSDSDSDGELYPIMMYIPNLKDSSPYKEGDKITVQSCKVKLAN